MSGKYLPNSIVNLYAFSSRILFCFCFGRSFILMIKRFFILAAPLAIIPLLVQIPLDLSLLMNLISVQTNIEYLARPAAHTECVFCNIESKEPEKIVFESEKYTAFWDRDPASTYHFLVVPKDHIRSIKNLDGTHVRFLEEMKMVADELISQNGGGRWIVGFHVPPFTSVHHLHLHVLGGEFKSVFARWKYADWKMARWFVALDRVQLSIVGLKGGWTWDKLLSFESMPKK